MNIEEIFDLGSRYSDKQEVFNGGSGDVYLCHDHHLERDVAIKVIRDQTERSRIDDEIQSIMTLRSKHVVQAYDVLIGKENALGLVLEYIDGPELSELDTKNLSELELTKILWQIASGISDIHCAGIVHRDLKPENIIIDREGIVKIIDFGLSRTEIDANTLGFKGTQGFAAPELFRDGIVNFTKAVDVYAFGAIALFATAGNLPAAMMKLPPEPVTINPFISTALGKTDDVSQLLGRSLDPKCDLRPEIFEIRDLLAGYLTKDRHQGLAVISGKHHLINSEARAISIKSGTLGKFIIRYDGIRFNVERIEGDIFVNSGEISGVSPLPGASVITLGDESEGNDRVYVTFDISKPEIAL